MSGGLWSRGRVDDENGGGVGSSENGRLGSERRTEGVEVNVEVWKVSVAGVGDGFGEDGSGGTGRTPLWGGDSDVSPKTDVPGVELVTQRESRSVSGSKRFWERD